MKETKGKKTERKKKGRTTHNKLCSILSKIALGKITTLAEGIVLWTLLTEAVDLSISDFAQ